MELSDIFSGPLTDAKWRALGDYISGSGTVTGPGLRTRRIGNKTVISAKRNRGSVGGGGTSVPCMFGDLVTGEAGTSIMGGLMICGDKNFNISDQLLDLDTDGEWLISIKCSGVECATDDDGEIFLPGVVTATGTPAWDNKAWTDPTDYDDTTNPTSPSSPNGDVVIPCGRLKITDGSPSFTAAGCGRIVVGHCAGILSHTRG